VSAYGDPENLVGVGRAASAADVLLVASRVDGDGVLERAYNSSAIFYLNGACIRTDTAGIQRPHVEDVDSLHLSEKFQTLETSGLLEIGRDGSGLGTGREKVLRGLDLYMFILVSD
jgi:hypothetical protein